MYRDSHPFWFPSRSLFFLFLNLFFSRLPLFMEIDEIDRRTSASIPFSQRCIATVLFGSSFRAGVFGETNLGDQGFYERWPSELPTSDILASSGAPALGVRLPCWEFRGPSGSSSRVHGSLNSARIFIVGSPCSFLGLLSVGIFLASARLRSRSDVPKTLRELVICCGTARRPAG